MITGPKQWPIAPNFSEPVNPYPVLSRTQKRATAPRPPAIHSDFLLLSGDTLPPPVVVSDEADEKRRDSGLF